MKQKTKDIITIISELIVLSNYILSFITLFNPILIPFTIFYFYSTFIISTPIYFVFSILRSKKFQS